ncbi:MAG: GNAT family N-acetyltransferase [Acidimicrobiales bacterium]|nr:GNAT family N-acetyltransferase [Acidimicrobiales bacterium]
MSASPLRTERTILLPLSANDLDEVGALYGDEDVMAYVDGGVRTRDQTKSALAAAERCWKAEGWGLWAIRDAETGGLIGEAGLQHLFDVDGAPVEFGFTLSKRHWGKGLATEAGHVILADAWERYTGDLIHAITDPENTASARVLNKLGFRQVEARLIHGESQLLWEIQRLR